MEPHFSGYATRYGVKCTDGRTIMPGAFQHQDGNKVPVVYQHVHTDIAQTLGHAILSKRDDGIWADVFLNDDVPNAKIAHALVKGGDIDKFSIWAKDLIEHGLDVTHGDIQEVSLVLAGANSGANIYNVLQHSGIDQDDLLIVGGEIMHADTATVDKPEEKTDEPSGDAEDANKDESGKTRQEVLDSLTDEQELAVNAAIEDIVTEAVTEALTKTEGQDLEHGDIDKKETQPVSRNAFDQSGQSGSPNLPQLKHADAQSVLVAAKGNPPEGIRGFNDGSAVGSMREFVRTSGARELMHADTYGVDNIDILFPDAQALMRTPTWVDRRQEWVRKFMAGTSHSPFSRVKTLHADITADEARAKGWIKGHEKTEEVFPVFKRTTGPTWVIKMQKLDRQDIIDITDFDVVAWMKAEMRGKLDEEIARAALFGDGRPTMVDIAPDGFGPGRG